MTEKEKQELIEMGFLPFNTWVSFGFNNNLGEYVELSINTYRTIKLCDCNGFIVIGKFESVDQIRPMIEGLKMFLS